MARPSLAKNLKKLPPDFHRIREPFTNLPQPSLRPKLSHDGPSSLDLASSKFDNRLRLIRDLEYEPSQVSRDSTYFQTYIKKVNAGRGGCSPLHILYCNYCWNRWPVVGVFCMDDYTLVRFVRGQCCPSCRDQESRENINDGLLRNGPSRYFIEQAQRLGMRTDRFPYLDPTKGPIRLKDIWSIESPNVGWAEDLWNAVRHLAPNPKPDIT